MTADHPYVKAGDLLSDKALGRLTTLVRFEPTREVQKKSDTRHGQWVCCDCGEPFQNNSQADSHEPRSHRLGWWTGEHVEAP